MGTKLPASVGGANKNWLWLLLLLPMVAMVARELPAMIRYIKIESM